MILASLALAACLMAQAQPSVLVILADDLGTTERALLTSLDSLAAQGTTFSRAYSWPVCSPTRDALLFGRYPRRDGLGWVFVAGWSPSGTRLPLAHLALPELFRGTGRLTSLTGKWHLGRAPLFGSIDEPQTGPYCQGFDAWLAGQPGGQLTGGPGTTTGYYAWNEVDEGNVAIQTEYATWHQRDKFIEWWTLTAQPKFAVLSWSAPHAPYDPPPNHIPTGTVRGDYVQIIENLNGALADVLAQIDLCDTYVVFTCDNGTPDDARPPGTATGYWKETTYEGGVTVPLIVAGPGISAGALTSRLVSLVDVPATLCELTGVAVPSGELVDSRSFANALGAWTGTTARTWIFTEVYTTSYDDQAVIESAWKLRRADQDGPGPIASVDLAYHLPSDPWEQAPIDPLLLPASLRNRLYSELASVPPRQ